MTALLFISMTIISYLIGSICSAVIVCKIFDLPDPRTKGSQNPGATNVLRIAGKQYAGLVLLGDMLKGFIPVLIAKYLEAGPIIVGFTCFAAVLGHMFPIFFSFKGGKGVATALGALLGFQFILGMMVIVTWILIANLTRYASFASICAIVAAPFYSLYVLGNLAAFLPLSFIAIMVIYKHHNNITRLMDGTESKITFKANQDILKMTSEKVSKQPTKKKTTPKKTKKTTSKKPKTKKTSPSIKK